MGKSSRVPFFILVFFVSLALLTGCAHQEKMAMEGTPQVKELESRLEQKEGEVSQLNSDLQQKDMMITKYQSELREIENMPAPLLPANAKVGECYARVFVAPQYQTVTEKVLKKQASEKIEVIPAQYKMVEEKIMVQEASERWEVIPAQYKWVEERVLVKEASSRKVEVPAVYEWIEEKILVEPAHTVWKKGRGLIEKVDNSTGELMCLVEIPAKYNTVKKKVIKTPATTQTIQIPAEYKMVKKKVMVSPPTNRKIVIPAEYKMVKVRKMVTPPREKHIAIPEEFGTVTKTEKVSEGLLEWRRVLCETNMGEGIIKRLQTALRDAGHDPGPIDGVVGWRTMRGVKSYQKAKGLAVGNITYEVLESLGLIAAR